MLKRLSQGIVDWQIRSVYLTEDERAIYEYAYELFLNQTINIILAVVVAFLFHDFSSVILFLVCYIPLRSFSGGYHANTNMGCTIISTSMLCFLCWIMNSSMTQWLGNIYLIFFFLSGYAVFKYVPVQDKNKPLDDIERVRYKKMSRLLWSVETLLGIICFFLKIQYGLVIAISHIMLFTILYLGILKNHNAV